MASAVADGRAGIVRHHRAEAAAGALKWLRNGAGAGLLADVAAGRMAATHEALDAHPHQRAADYLRHMLTAGAMLPYRDEELARTEQWLVTLLKGISDPATRRLVQSFATWQVMRLLRRNAGQAGRPGSVTAHARNQISAAAGFLAWLDGRRPSPIRRSTSSRTSADPTSPPQPADSSSTTCRTVSSARPQPLRSVTPSLQ